MTLRPASVVLAKRLGLMLQRQRRRHAMTQDQLAESVGMSLKYLGEVERGEANPTLDTLAGIALALDWDPWTLFGTVPVPISQAVHQVLLADFAQALQILQGSANWLRALDPMPPDFYKVIRETDLLSESEGGNRSDELPPPRRGRTLLRPDAR